MSSLVAEAGRIAILAHEGQKRKNTGEDYICHPFRAFNILSRHLRAFKNEDIVIAGEPYTKEQILAMELLHDVIEDCPDRFAEMISSTSQVLYNMVYGLSNPSRFMEGKPRAERKQVDFDHIAVQPYSVKLGKIADRLDNWDCFKREYTYGKYFRLYTEETQTLVKVLTPPSFVCVYSELLAELDYQVNGEH